MQHVCQVLQRLLENCLFVKVEKYQFHAPSVSFLGYIVAKGQLFLDFANYRTFIRNHSSIAAPLTALTSTSKQFQWIPVAEAAFQDSEPFHLCTIHSARSNKAVCGWNGGLRHQGGGSSQSPSEDGKLHPCAFLFHRLSPAKLNYDVGNCELLWWSWLWWSGGIGWRDQSSPSWSGLTIKIWHYIQAKRLNARQARWTVLFGRFSFTLIYRQGLKLTFWLTRQLASRWTFLLDKHIFYQTKILNCHLLELLFRMSV